MNTDKIDDQLARFDGWQVSELVIEHTEGYNWTERRKVWSHPSYGKLQSSRAPAYHLHHDLLHSVILRLNDRQLERYVTQELPAVVGAGRDDVSRLIRASSSEKAAALANALAHDV